MRQTVDRPRDVQQVDVGEEVADAEGVGERFVPYVHWEEHWYNYGEDCV